MKIPSGHFWVLLLILLHAVGLALFVHGYLLVRLELEAKSYCLDLPLNLKSADNETSCWAPKHFKRTVWIIIDALRFDFVVKNGTAGAILAGLPLLSQQIVQAVRPFISITGHVAWKQE